MSGTTQSNTDTTPSRRKGIKRIFTENMEIFHDLFKLIAANMVKNVSWNDTPQWVDTVHEHFYHTVDSSGRKLKFSAPVGGHFHEMKVTKNAAGEVVEVECVSGPLRFVKMKVEGRMKKVPAPFNDKDKHKHETEYVYSNTLRKAKLNDEAVKHMSQMMQKQTSKAVTDEDGNKAADLDVT